MHNMTKGKRTIKKIHKRKQRKTHDICPQSDPIYGMLDTFLVGEIQAEESALEIIDNFSVYQEQNEFTRIQHGRQQKNRKKKGD